MDIYIDGLEQGRENEVVEEILDLGFEVSASLERSGIYYTVVIIGVDERDMLGDLGHYLESLDDEGYRITEE
tara:strand:- start:621 stop:836 length:216 start_codon:yes stop_codon:yes gene_type:complete